MESGSMVLLPAKGDTAYTDIREYLTSVNIVYIEGVDPHLNIVQGDAFTDAMGVSDVLNAWMHLSLADEMGVSPGEEFELALNAADEGIRMRIAGIWQAADGKTTSGSIRPTPSWGMPCWSAALPTSTSLSRSCPAVRASCHGTSAWTIRP